MYTFFLEFHSVILQKTYSFDYHFYTSVHYIGASRHPKENHKWIDCKISPQREKYRKKILMDLPN